MIFTNILDQQFKDRCDSWPTEPPVCCLLNRSSPVMADEEKDIWSINQGCYASLQGSGKTVIHVVMKFILKFYLFFFKFLVNTHGCTFI